MALAYQIHPTAGQVMITCLGRLDSRDWRTCLRLLATDQRLAPGFRIVVDARSVAAVDGDFVSAMLGGLTTWWAELGRSSWTLLAGEQADVEQLRHLFTVHAPGMGVRIVTSKAVALRGRVTRLQWGR
jgi:hypothetical protein